MVFLKNHGEGGSAVELHPLPQRFALLTENGEKTPFSTHLKIIETFDMPVEEFLASIRFENKGILDEFPLEKGG